ncbi:hypothetical protein D3C86_1851900 [compost metagenome]
MHVLLNGSVSRIHSWKKKHPANKPGGVAALCGLEVRRSSNFLGWVPELLHPVFSLRTQIYKAIGVPSARRFVWCQFQKDEGSKSSFGYV